MKRSADTLATIILLAGLALACARITVGCTPIDPQAEAATGYAAQQQNCVLSFETRSDIDACRAKVRAAWATDAGADR